SGTYMTHPCRRSGSLAFTDPRRGNRHMSDGWADLTVNLLLYAGPVFGGAMLVNHSCALCKSVNFEPRSVKDLSPIENEFVLPAFRKLREGTGHPAILVMPGKSNALHQPLKCQLRDRL